STRPTANTNCLLGGVVSQTVIVSGAAASVTCAFIEVTIGFSPNPGILNCPIPNLTFGLRAFSRLYASCAGIPGLIPTTSGIPGEPAAAPSFDCAFPLTAVSAKIPAPTNRSAFILQAFIFFSLFTHLTNHYSDGLAFFDCSTSC